MRVLGSRDWGVTQTGAGAEDGEIRCWAMVVKRSASTCSRKASPVGSGQPSWRGHQGDTEEAAPMGHRGSGLWWLGLVDFVAGSPAGRSRRLAVGVAFALARHETSHASAACPFGLFGRALDFSYFSWLTYMYKNFLKGAKEFLKKKGAKEI